MTQTPNRLFRTTVALAAALSLVAAAGSAAAEEAEAPAAPPATTASTSVYHLFTSWFAGKPKVDADVAADEANLPAPVGAVDGAPPATFTARAGALVSDALGLIGISYRMGGNTPSSGFDCSGMVRYVYQSALGLSLPRRAEEISRVGVKVALNELKPGDLVFYKTLRKTFSHVGIYLGNNRFIHAPSAGGAVRIDDMTSGYWTARFNGARRIDG